MPWKNSDSRYSTVSIALHWLMLVLLALVYACIEFRGIFPKGSGGRTLIVESHFMLGLTVFVLVWLRCSRAAWARHRKSSRPRLTGRPCWPN